ncbi:hypothetical protein [Amycolatopsis sp. NPDC051903]|uniref:hypothetical protein n=1 Tax=Amycolatopsis sp. NPDC051903 TaxID=3363936 RepID=UPI0037A359A3
MSTKKPKEAPMTALRVEVLAPLAAGGDVAGPDIVVIISCRTGRILAAGVVRPGEGNPETRIVTRVVYEIVDNLVWDA